MIYSVNKALRSTILTDSTAERQLDMILRVMNKHTFGLREATKIVGGDRTPAKTDGRWKDTLHPD